VAWYPVYRIPDAPLTARFLTFHSLALQQLPSLMPQEAPRAGGPEPRLWYAPVQGAQPCSVASDSITIMQHSAPGCAY
jgi:Protein of unknown function (DUF789)